MDVLGVGLARGSGAYRCMSGAYRCMSGVTMIGHFRWNFASIMASVRVRVRVDYSVDNFWFRARIR